MRCWQRNETSPLAAYDGFSLIAPEPLIAPWFRAVIRAESDVVPKLGNDRTAGYRIMAQVNVEIVKRSDRAKGFSVLPKRRVVERTFAWLNRCRSLAKDWECLNRTARA